MNDFSRSDDQSAVSAPTSAEFFGVCVQLLAAAQQLADIAASQSEEIRQLLALAKVNGRM